MNLPGLALIERWALRILHRSPRIGLLIVKRYELPQMAYSVASDDPEAIEMAKRLVGDPDPEQELEPASMVLERIYHLPAYGEDE